ncbi:MAG: STAS domain-containing protein [Kiritimatiellae bacterium]|nr:STAS domain-containing protein [Kiritimatiellia bacterium]
MNISTSKIDQAVVMELAGRMDVIAAMEYEKAIMACLQRGDLKFVVDLNALDYVSSAGLRSLLTTAKKVKESKGMVNFCNVKGVVKEVFAMSGFDTILPIFKSVKDALPS